MTRSTLALLPVLGAALVGPEPAFSLAQDDSDGLGPPAARAHHQLVYHGGEGRAYLIGGSTRRGEGYHYFDEVWTWDGDAWTPDRPLPFPRSSQRVVYHEERGSLILFGGGFAQAVRADGVLWEKAEEGWRAVGGDFRAGSGEPGMCYDPLRSTVVIFGGWGGASATTLRAETWEWAGQGEALALVDTAGPSPRAGHAFLWDPVGERCLLFGGRGDDGLLGDTWAWDGEGWKELAVPGPAPRWFFGSATDPESRRLLLFGGGSSGGDLGDTWAWDGAAWERLADEGPVPRSMAKMAFAGNGIVLFGGRQSTEDGFRDWNDTWVWEDDARGWERR